MLQEIGFTQESPDPICEDNGPMIDIVRSSIPTGKNLHIYAQFFFYPRMEGSWGYNHA